MISRVADILLAIVCTEIFLKLLILNSIYHCLLPRYPEPISHVHIGIVLSNGHRFHE